MYSTCVLYLCTLPVLYLCTCVLAKVPLLSDGCFVLVDISPVLHSHTSAPVQQDTLRMPIAATGAGYISSATALNPTRPLRVSTVACSAGVALASWLLSTSTSTSTSIIPQVQIPKVSCGDMLYRDSKKWRIHTLDPR
jgi:hypothetical protein